ncbi:NucA/NucB deoxyribonuclease domain-containing protein [Streptomyces griseocarneus]|uniref:NucA/NucB deoxyribonuclease domain-containing protein n=1 Tax=Streptomyces griseocarneus TaxID=51201 RepID=UPI00167E3EF2|nr:hypothetical protein [Streptomyces griseocarneus]MBZ6476149.1 hypothetical protein [Streptomyces griseocarneus]GHG63705.1 hypothetical protein GCM10018779_33570 [Streptomyces griseocarneus]
MKRVRQLLAAIASLALTAALLALGTSQAAAAPATARPAPHGQGTCKPVPPGKGAPKDAAWACYKISSRSPAPARALAPAPRDGDDPNSPDSLCGKQPPDNSTRLAYCMTKGLRWTYLSSDQKTVIGGAEGDLAIYSRLKDTPKANWTESAVAILRSKTDNIPAVEVALLPTCIGQCAVTSGPVVAKLEKVGGEGGGSITYSSSVSKGTQALVRPQYHLELDILLPSERLPSVNTDWLGPQIRCDDMVGQWPGCVIPEHMANVTIRKSLYRAAAVTYEWAQKNLTTFSMGTEAKPLHRKEATEKEIERRRDITCNLGPDKFVRDNSLVPDDSCDEFPFAASQEGGNAGSLCVDILPQQVGGVWDVKNVKVLRNGANAANAPCVRSHVTRADNVAAGRDEFGAAVRSDRIIDNEPFQVIIP